jgi:cysteinyl-tRNA synthetase
MSKKYLGNTFDIHGGGLDLTATHHTNEISQSQACNHQEPARYWMHTNMLTVNGTRMSKSAGNGFLPGELFSGNHTTLSKAFSPMTVRFFMLQAHYRSTLDFSNEALEASEKGFKRLLHAVDLLDGLKSSDQSNCDVAALNARGYAAMNDDFNSPILIAELFEAVKLINGINDGKVQISTTDLASLSQFVKQMVFDVLGLKSEGSEGTELAPLMELIIKLRNEAKAKQDYATSDKIRIALQKAGIQLNDSKESTTWTKL